MSETRIDRREFLKLIGRSFEPLTVKTERKIGNTTVLLCSCGGKTSIKMKELAEFVKELGVKDVVLHNELCGMNGRSQFKIVAESLPENLLVAACTKNLVFSDIVTQLNYPIDSLHTLGLQELCGWVHDDPEGATEKAKRMLASALLRIFTRKLDEPPQGKQRLAVNKVIDPKDLRALYGKLEACPAKDGVCLVCRDLCPQNAIVHSEHGIRIDGRSCNVCGICENICPLELLKVSPREDPSPVLSQMLKGKRILETEVIAFVCENLAKLSLNRLGSMKMTYPAGVLPISLRCLSELSPILILQAFSRGAQGVIMIGCDDCLCNSQNYLNNLVDMLDKGFVGGVLEGRLETIRSNGKDSEKILESIKNFYDKIVQRKRLDIKYLQKFYARRRDEFIDLISNLNRYADLQKTIAAHKLVPFGFLDVETKDCDLCLRCVEACMVGALEVREEALSFNHGKCIGCGLCVSACEKGLIKLSREIHVAFLDKETKLISTKKIANSTQ